MILVFRPPIGSAGLLCAAIVSSVSCSAQEPRADIVFDSVASWTVGAIDASGGHAFGSISDAATTAAGGVLILDEQNFTLSWYSRGGSLLDQVGRNGGGPGEFSVPRGLSVGDDGLVDVLDARNYRISQFRLADSVIKHVRDIRVPLLGDDLCYVEDRFVVNARGSGTALHVVDPSGTVTKSFGPQLTELDADARTSTWFNRTGLQNDGFLACGNSSTPIVFAHRELRYVRGFDLEGNELWRTALSDFHRVHWVASDGGRRMTESPDPESGTAMYTMGVSLGPENTVLVGSYETWLDGPVQYYTYVLSAETGKELGRIRSPFIIFGYVAGRAYGRRRTPFPTISMVAATILQPLR